MQLHELNTSFKKGKKIGRGGKKGTYAGRGQNGQKSRAGTRFQPIIREWIKKYHKLRGYNFNVRTDGPSLINLNILEKNFKEGEVVSPISLVEKGVVSKKQGKLPKVKILSEGTLTKPLSIENCSVSAKAKEAIEKLKGEIK